MPGDGNSSIGGSISIGEALLPEFGQEMADTRMTLEPVPDRKFDRKPHLRSLDRWDG
jgi:hypothetical protein